MCVCAITCVCLYMYIWLIILFYLLYRLEKLLSDSSWKWPGQIRETCSRYVSGRRHFALVLSCALYLNRDDVSCFPFLFSSLVKRLTLISLADECATDLPIVRWKNVSRETLWSSKATRGVQYIVFRFDLKSAFIRIRIFQE